MEYELIWQVAPAHVYSIGAPAAQRLWTTLLLLDRPLVHIHVIYETFPVREAPGSTRTVIEGQWSRTNESWRTTMQWRIVSSKQNWFTAGTCLISVQALDFCLFTLLWKRQKYYLNILFLEYITARIFCCKPSCYYLENSWCVTLHWT